MDILLISADDQFAGLLERSITTDGRTITRMRSAEEALPVIMAAQGISVICDDPLPGMSGMELLKRVKLAMAEGAKFILISEVQDGRMVLDYIKRGLRDFVIRDEGAADAVNAILNDREADALFPDM